MAATNIAQSPEEQQKKAQEQANTSATVAQQATQTATVAPQAPQVATASPIAKTEAGETPNYYKEAAKQQEENAKKYEGQAQRYTPESDEDAKKRARKERIGLIHAGVFDGLAALSNLYAAHRGGVAGTYDPSKGTSVALGTAFEKAQQHREQNRQIYDNYMDKAKAAQLSANQLLQQWEDKQLANKVTQEQLDMARKQLDIQMADEEFKKQLRPYQLDEAKAKAAIQNIISQNKQAEINAKIAAYYKRIGKGGADGKKAKQELQEYTETIIREFDPATGVISKQIKSRVNINRGNGGSGNNNGNKANKNTTGGKHTTNWDIK